MSELLPCPFCGGDNLRQFKNCIVCDNCGCFGPEGNQRVGVQLAIRIPAMAEAWNTRADHDHLKAENAALRERLDRLLRGKGLG